MQHVQFPDGGYVLHKITGDFSGRVSAWFDKTGNLVDAEQLLPSGKSRPLRKAGPLWSYVSAVGYNLRPVSARVNS